MEEGTDSVQIKMIDLEKKCQSDLSELDASSKIFPVESVTNQEESCLETTVI